ncbi:tyrosine--tRNA ligase [Buchnera aphidicola]|uniref:tyrosine--tRNA ligase n=1 Tax=Buchnera aphidicola TaxID=9 RepID=UPI0031B7FC75
MINKEIIKKFKKYRVIDKITNEHNFLQEIKKYNKITLYCGFDPTSDSLHIGHILPILFLKKIQKYKNKIIFLIGGSTSLIGDPSFKNSERKLISKNVILKYQKNLELQILSILKRNFSIKNTIILNNNEWFNKINILDFLRNIGKHFSVNQMIHKSSVKDRINKIDKGMSFTEFSYSLLQAYDFSYLYKNYNVILQIGGSDQWGNIVSGINLTKKLYKKKVFGITIPLFTKKNGKKFGKSENNSIWLDRKKTSIYDFYQFWLNISDKEAKYFIKIFYFFNIISKKKINNTDSIKNIIKNKYIIADAITKFVHGKNYLYIVKKITKMLFRKNFFCFKEIDFMYLTKKYIGVPKIYINKKNNLSEILKKTMFANSLNKARKIVVSGAVRINNIVKKDCKYVLKESDKIFSKYCILCIGKKRFYILHCK